VCLDDDFYLVACATLVWQCCVQDAEEPECDLLVQHYDKRRCNGRLTNRLLFNDFRQRLALPGGRVRFRCMTGWWFVKLTRA
jgi:hypothetical protein